MKEGFFVQQSMYRSPLGPLFLWFADDKLVYTTFHEESGKCWLEKHFPTASWNSKPLQTSYQGDLDVYFRGRKIDFDWPLHLIGTDFQQNVWQEIRKVRHGEVTTYKKIGESLGTRAYRAIGQAVGANPISLIVPCHRILGTGSLGGYGGGINLKRLLLELENVTLAPNLLA